MSYIRAFKQFFIFIVLILIISCGSSDIDIVKEGVLLADDSMSVLDAIEGCVYVDSVEWKTYKTKQNQVVVEAVAKLNKQKIIDESKNHIENEIYFSTVSKEYATKDRMENKKALSNVKEIFAVLQFMLSKDKKSFSPVYSGHRVKYMSGEIKEDRHDQGLENLYKNRYPLSSYLILVSKK